MALAAFCVGGQVGRDMHIEMYIWQNIKIRRYLGGLLMYTLFSSSRETKGLSSVVIVLCFYVCLFGIATVV